jgi:hypothetical protein
MHLSVYFKIPTILGFSNDVVAHLIKEQRQQWEVFSAGPQQQKKS